MTTLIAPNLPTAPIPTRESLWDEAFMLREGSRQRTVALTNFAGRNYPTPDSAQMTRLLQIEAHERVLEVGSSEMPLARTDVLTGLRQPFAHRNTAIQFVPSDLETLPFSDHAFDVVIARLALQEARDPAAACRELQRVAKRGFIETPAPLAEYLGGRATSRWLVRVENLPGRAPTLVFQRKAFRRAPFRSVLRPLWYQDEDFRIRWEWAYRNVTHTQFAWDESFAFRVEDSPEGLDYDDPMQAAEAHLDTAICALRFGGVPAHAILPDAERACELCPDWALAHNARGCALWLDRQSEEAIAAFQEAHRLEPDNLEYAHNARVRTGMTGVNGPHLVLLPPDVTDKEDIVENFAGKVYYAFRDFDARLAEDMGIQPGELVLDVGGGQRPLKRADVNLDFDVFEGIHRQGLTISREKPLVCGDVQRLPFRDHAFDAVCCRMVLEHVLDPAAACRELQRVAKRGFIETPNTFWECFYGHPTHRWLIEWEAPTRTIVFRRKPFDSIPFKSAIVPHLYRDKDIQRAFEVVFRNITTTQVTWDENTPFSCRVEDDPNCPYDYLARPEDAARGSWNYARDLFQAKLAPVAVTEAEDAIRLAPTPALRERALRLRLQIAETMHDALAAARCRAELLSPTTGNTILVSQTQSAPSPLPPLLWNAPLRDPSGYADEARHFLFALDAAGFDLSARAIRWSEKVAVLPAERERILQKLLSRAEPANAVHVCHILASHFFRVPNARANVGRTMFETDRLPAGWADACNQMDAVWVPGEFNRETFIRAGVQARKLRIVPGAIDLTPYNPDCAPLHVQGARGFNFLSVFDWTLRKGWDVMIRAFVEEFRPDEDVALLIKTHSSMGYTTQQIVGMIADFVTNVLGRDPNRIPDIVLQDANVPDQRMPNLYRAADCYVMPTRGEGWGRPFMEAMAMCLPVIATGWSGQTAFLNADNSHVLDHELADVPEIGWRETPTYRGHRWAEPSLPHLRTLMRRAFEDREAGRALGQKARAHLETHFTYTPVARIIASELERLA